MHNKNPHNPSRQLRAQGNLTYTEFIRLVQRLWEESHPDIPFIPTGPDQPAKYPCIYYGLDSRTTHSDDPKMRLRETIDNMVIMGQRFVNIVRFTSITESDPLKAEAVMETFEDFMFDIIPVLKENGLSEIVYARRYPDTQENRAGLGVVRRSVSYLVTTEKIKSVEYSRLDRISINARTFIEESRAVGPLDNSWEPRYFLVSGLSPDFFIYQEDLENSPPTISVPGTYFRIGDSVYLAPARNNASLFPPSISPGYFIIGNIIGNPYSSDIKYTLQKRSSSSGEYEDVLDFGPDDPGQATPSVIYGGKIFFDPDKKVDVSIVDEFRSENYYTDT